MIECAFFGFLARDAELRTSQAGKPWARLSVGAGKDDTIQWISVAVFGNGAAKAAELKKGDRVYVEGTIRLGEWLGKDGTERQGLNVAASKCEPVYRIGRNRPQQKRRRAVGHNVAAGSHFKPIAAAAIPFNDELPW